MRLSSEEPRIYYVRGANREIFGTVAIARSEDCDDVIDRAVAVTAMRESGCKRVGRQIALERLRGLRACGKKDLGYLPCNKASMRFLFAKRGQDIPTPLYRAERGVKPNSFEARILRMNDESSNNKEVVNG